MAGIKAGTEFTVTLQAAPTITAKAGCGRSGRWPTRRPGPAGCA